MKFLLYIGLTWRRSISLLQTNIQDYGQWYVSIQCEIVDEGKLTCKLLIELSHITPLSNIVEDVLCRAKHVLLSHDKHKLEK